MAGPREEFRKLLRGAVDLAATRRTWRTRLPSSPWRALQTSPSDSQATRCFGRRRPVDLRNAAGQVASATRSQSSIDPAITTFLRASSSEDRYWRLVLNYCAKGACRASSTNTSTARGLRRPSRQEANGLRQADAGSPDAVSATMTVDRIAVDPTAGPFR